MRVLIDLTSLNSLSRFRGIGRYARCLASALAQISPPDIELHGLARLDRGLDNAFEDLNYPGDEDRALTRASDFSTTRDRRWRIRAAVRVSKSALLHRPDPAGTPLLAGCPQVVTCHDLIPLVLHNRYFPGRPWAHLKERLRAQFRYGRAHRIIAVSEATRRDLIDRLRITPETIDVVHHGIDHTVFHPQITEDETSRIQNRLKTQRPFVIYVGGTDPRKNVPELIHAYDRSRIAEDVDLVLIGSDAPHDHRVRAAVEATRRGRVILPGWLDDASTAAAYRAAVASIFPSSYEGFGFPALESMASGCPTLTNRGSSLNELIGEGALTYELDEPDALQQGIERVVEDAQLQHTLHTLGPRAAAPFTWQRCAEKTLEVYRRTLMR